MTLALLTLHLVSLTSLSITIHHGAGIAVVEGAMGRHLTWGLVSVLLGVFTHTMTLFYFIGIASSMRRAVEEYGKGADRWHESRKLKSQVMPWVTGAMALLMVTFILGGGAHTRALPGWVHSSLGYLVLLVSVLVVLVEAYFLLRQNALANDLQRLLQGEEAQSSLSPAGSP